MNYLYKCTLNYSQNYMLSFYSFSYFISNISVKRFKLFHAYTHVYDKRVTGEQPLVSFILRNTRVKTSQLVYRMCSHVARSQTYNQVVSGNVVILSSWHKIVTHNVLVMHTIAYHIKVYIKVFRWRLQARRERWKACQNHPQSFLSDMKTNLVQVVIFSPGFECVSLYHGNSKNIKRINTKLCMAN
jgi:hypothetical protein